MFTTCICAILTAAGFPFLPANGKLRIEVEYGSWNSSQPSAFAGSSRPVIDAKPTVAISLEVTLSQPFSTEVEASGRWLRIEGTVYGGAAAFPVKIGITQEKGRELKDVTKLETQQLETTIRLPWNEWTQMGSLKGSSSYQGQTVYSYEGFRLRLVRRPMDPK